MEGLRAVEEEIKKPCPSKLYMWPNVTSDNGVSANSSAETDHSISKENRTSCVAGSNLSSSQNRPPLRSNSVIANQPESTPGKSGIVVTKSICSSSTVSFENQEPRRDEAGNIDWEIEAIEKEISRLSSRLQYLRLEKARQTPVKTAAEKRGRFIPAKFLDPSPSLVLAKQNPRKIEEPTSARKITPRSRGLSMAPSEIVRELNMAAAAAAAAAATPVGRRGISLGPAEIYSATRAKQFAKQQAITPVYQSQSRRKSCFWKLQEVDELKVIKERGKSMSMSPKSRKNAAANLKQAVTSLGAAKNKSIKKEDALISWIQPKKLFKDGEKSAPVKKPLKSGRIIPSRYHSKSSIDSNGNSAASSTVRKRSLPENDKEVKICDKKRISLSGKSEVVSEIGLRPLEASVDDPLWVTLELEALPKIRTLQCLVESPRDSGPAKRVVDLVRRKSHFSLDEDERDEEVEAVEEEEEVKDRVQPTSACKTLSFEDEEED